MEKHPYRPFSRRAFLKASAPLIVGASIRPASLTTLLPDPAPGSSNKGIKYITILHTSDMHGQVNVHDEFFWEDNQAVFRKCGGFAHLKTMVNQLRKQNPNTLLVDSGDTFQGSALAQFSEGSAMIPLLNDLCYDVLLPGNWEVIYGKKKMISNLNTCNALKVCTNMWHDDTNAFIFPPYQVIRCDGINIGLIGYNDPLTAIRQSPAYSKGITFCAPEKNMAKFVRILKEEKKCDLIFALTHMGMMQQLDLSNQPYAEGVDFILGGDTHERIHEPIAGKFAKVTEPGAFASFVGKLDLTLENGIIKEQQYKLLEVDPEKYSADPRMLRLIDHVYKPYYKETRKIIGTTATPLYRYFILENPLDDLITDALMWKASPDIAFSNGFRFCPPLVPDAKTGYAAITEEFLWSMLPVNADVKTAEVTGQQLWDWLERELENVFSKNASTRFGGWLIRFSGMKIQFTIGNDFGKRLEYVNIQGEKIDFAKTYSILACERDGDPDNLLCRIKNVQHTCKPGYTLHDVMKAYLQKHSPVSPKIEGRVIATDAPVTLLTPSMGVHYQFR